MIAKRSWPIPYPPFLSFASIELWYRLLNRPRARIPVRYAARVILGGAISLVITLLTLPERLLIGLWLKLRKPTFPGPVIILGYYRSGTTHLQFLLSRDPNLYSPRWNQALSPQGFLVSWSLLNWFLLPFFPNKRPQDNAAFGTDIPAEDDFALANGALVSSLIGRHVLPELRDHYDRYHDLGQLQPEELQRYRDCQLGFVQKLAVLAGQRRILLKTPSHTARVEELQSLLAGHDGVRFIHISRNPDATYRSNVGLHRVLNEMYHLQDPLPDEEIRERIVREYLATEQRYLEAREKIPAGRLAEVRMEDLMADPIHEVKRIYAALSLPYSEQFEQQLLEYLDATRRFEQNKHQESNDPEARQVAERLEGLKRTFGHDRPAIPRQDPPAPQCLMQSERQRRMTQAVIRTTLIGVTGLALWLLLTWVVGIRLDALSWLTGIAVGYTAIGTIRRGSLGLGLWCATITLALACTGSLVTTRWIPEPILAELVFVVFWGVLGTLGAFRLATRSWI